MAKAPATISEENEEFLGNLNMSEMEDNAQCSGQTYPSNGESSVQYFNSEEPSDSMASNLPDNMGRDEAVARCHELIEENVNLRNAMLKLNKALQARAKHDEELRKRLSSGEGLSTSHQGKDGVDGINNGEAFTSGMSSCGECKIKAENLEQFDREKKELTSEIDSMKVQVAESSQKAECLKREVESLNEQLQQNKDVNNEEYNKLKDRTGDEITQLRSTVQNLREEIERQKLEKEAVENQQSRSGENQVELERQISLLNEAKLQDQSHHLAETKALQDQLVLLNKSNDQLKESLDNYKKAFDLKEAEINKVLAENAQLKCSQESQVKELTEKLSELKAENSHISDEGKNFEQNTLVLKGEINKLTAEKRQLEDELQSVKVCLEREKQSNSDHIHRMDLHVKQLGTEFEATKGALQSHVQQKELADRELRSLHDQLKQSEEEKHVLRGHITSLVGELQEEKDRVEANSVTMEQQRERVRNLEESLKQREREMQTQVEKDDDVIERLSSDLCHTQQQRDDVVAENMTIKAELDKVNAEYSPLVRKYHNLAKEATRIEQIKKEKEEQIDNLTAQLITAEELVEDRKAQIEQLTGRNAQLLEQVNTLQSEIANEKTKAGVYEADFNAERQSREEAHHRYTQLTEIVKQLEYKNKTLEEQIEQMSENNLATLRHRYGSTVRLSDGQDHYTGSPRGQQTNDGAEGAMEGNQGIQFELNEDEQVEVLVCPICSKEQPDQETLELHARECTEYQE